MSEGSQAPPPRSEPPPSWLLAILGAVLCLATIVALWGVMSVVLDRDVLDHRDTGPLLGPAMVLAACTATGLALRRAPTTVSARSLATRGAGAAASAWAAILATGAIGYAIAREDPLWVMLFAAHYALSPFIIGAAVVAGLIALLGAWLATTARRD